MKHAPCDQSSRLPGRARRLFISARHVPRVCCRGWLWSFRYECSFHRRRSQDSSVEATAAAAAAAAADAAIAVIIMKRYCAHIRQRR